MSLKRIVVLPDIHTPNHNHHAIKAVLQFIKFYKPDTLIQLGDFCDWDSLSSYDVNRESEIQNIDKEIREANFLLDDIDSACSRNCKKIMIGGNHEIRYEKFKVNKGAKVEFKRIRELTSWELEYNLYGRGWDSFSYGQHVQIGKLIFTHGWGRTCTPKRMAERYPGRNVIYGHTHQHLIYGCLDERDMPVESESIGTLSNFNLSYLNGEPASHWVNSFMYIDMRDDGSFSKHFTHVIGGRFIEHNREFKT